MTENSISIDGPTASGKTTLGVELARCGGAAFLDTGLTFRALAYAIQRGDLTVGADWRHVIDHRPLMFTPSEAEPEAAEAVLYQGKDITAEIWSGDLDETLRSVAADQSTRAQILRLHRDIVARHRRVVVVGRDVAVTLLPTAALHVYLTASLPVRKERRRAQYRAEPGRSLAVGEATARDLENRAAIQAMANSLDIDSTHLSAAAVLDKALRGLGVETL